MRSLRTRTTLITVSTALALTLTACGSDDEGSSNQTVSTPGPASAATVNGISTDHNDADITFIKDMTPHHKGAVAMAELAATRAEDPKVKDLAQRILAAQQPELDTLAAMATAWEVTLTEDGGGHGGGHSGGGMGSEMDGDVAALTPLTGAAFDKEFLTRMIAHHEGALPMAQANLDGGQNPQAKELATAIVATQTTEIDEMKTLLAAP